MTEEKYDFKSAEEEKKHYKKLMKESTVVSEEESNEIIGAIKQGLLKKRMTSIRLEESLIEDLKHFAGEHGLPYQAYMRMVLTRHVSRMKEKEKRRKTKHA